MGTAGLQSIPLARIKFGKLNFATGEITEYPVPMPKAAPHSPLIDKDGRVWMPFANAKTLSYLDMETGKITIIADPSLGAHTLAFDRDGNI
jgi:streptogramin lyase